MARYLNQTRIAMLASIVIGWRQLHHSWRLLLLTGSGMLVALLLALFVPLYSYQSLESGLLAAIAHSNANPAFASQSTYVAISTSDFPLLFLQQSSFYDQQDQAVEQAVSQQVGAYLLPEVERSVEIPSLNMGSQYLGAHQYLDIVGTSITAVAPTLKLTQGRLPDDNATIPASPTQPLEVAISGAEANRLQLSVGSRLAIPMTIPPNLGFPNAGATVPFTIQVVGIFQTPIASSLPFFEQNPFHVEQFPNTGGPSTIIYPMLTGQKSLLALLQNPDIARGLAGAKVGVTVAWYYQPNLARFTVDNLTDVANRFDQLAQNLNQTIAQSAAGQFTVASALIGQDTPLQTYQAQVQVATIPITILLIDIMAILLFFITLITELYIGGQAATIAQLRSRGISRLQIFSGYLLPSVGVGLAALAVAVALFFPLAMLVLPHLLTAYAPPPTFVQALGRGWWYALAVGAFAIVAFWLSIGIALQADVLEVRHESSRTVRPPLWQRLRLDLSLGIVLVISFGVSLYLVQTAPNAQTAESLVPLSLLAPTFLVMAGMLFVLRGLPWFFRQIARLAARRRGAVAFLACLQLARTPQTLMRLLLVFALTIAFMVSVFVFAASQTARVQDLAAQQVGVDIVGYINVPDDTASPAQITSRFMSLPQVHSVTVGIKDVGNPIVVTNTSLVDILALDTESYQRTAIWPGQTSPQQLHSLLASLIAQRASAIQADEVPALVNASTWNDFHLSSGAVFHLAVSGYGTNQSMKFVALAEVPTIPSLDPTQAGILADYQTYCQVRQKDTQSPPITPFIVWLRLNADASSQATLAAAATSPQTALTNTTDRPAIQTQLQNDPVAALIERILLSGLALPLVLAFIGNIIAVWTQLRQQNVILALARALGMDPTQIRDLLIWEMGLMQGLALLLGSLFGAVLAFTLTPALIFSTITPNQSISAQGFFVLQSVLPVRIVLSPAVLVALGAFLVITGSIIVVGVASLRRRAISQALRLNED